MQQGELIMAIKELKVIKHFIEFYSPGTFVPEITLKSIKDWNISTAKRMAHSIIERHGARPYGFRFITKSRNEKDLDSKVIKRSNVYYLGGVIKTLEDVKNENNPKNEILIGNMERNKINRIIENSNSWLSTTTLEKGDIVLDFKLRNSKK